MVELVSLVVVVELVSSATLKVDTDELVISDDSVDDDDSMSIDPSRPGYSWTNVWFCDPCKSFLVSTSLSIVRSCFALLSLSKTMRVQLL